jgi:hypothetical protein
MDFEKRPGAAFEAALDLYISTFDEDPGLLDWPGDMTEAEVTTWLKRAIESRKPIDPIAVFWSDEQRKAWEAGELVI